MTEQDRNRIAYAFGHLCSAYARPDDAHAADSADLARDEMQALGFTDETTQIVEVIAEHVAADYQYTGEGADVQRRIEGGNL